ncbi:MAG: polysaccharide biosynthesis protein [Devosia sp.]
MTVFAEATVNALRNLPRGSKRIILVAADLVTVSFAIWGAFALRYGDWWAPPTPEALLVILAAPLIAVPTFAMLGLYRSVLRFLPEEAVWSILRATTLATLIWVMLVFVFQFTNYFIVPRSVPLIFWLLCTLLIGGSRYVAKQVLWRRRGPISGEGEPGIVIYGAGPAGAQLATAIRQQGSGRVVAFIDETAALENHDVAGIRVHPPKRLGDIVARYRPAEVILSGAILGAEERQGLLASLAERGIRLRTLPPINDVISGKYLVNQIREIDIDDLLGRSSVPPDPTLIRNMVEGRTIMVTGAGGSIGSELCRLIAKWSPAKLVLLEANEFALYELERRLLVPGGVIVPVLGTITEKELVSRVLGQHGVEVVFHAAAYKHVPLVEANVLEGIRNNVLGTQVLADAAQAQGVRDFVLISSDKAVRPTNVMGATKRWAEFIVQQKAFEAQAAGTGQRFCAVRFGNVLGSNGSVVPLFKEQIAAGGPVTVTDPAMTRYFMSIHEAAELIVQAGSLSKSGDLFLLDMGQPILIRDLAKNMIKLAGFSARDDNNPEGDIAISIIGTRPGEKLYEELFYNPAAAAPTSHPKILRTGLRIRDRGMCEHLARLRQALASADEVRARQVLFGLIEDGNGATRPAPTPALQHSRYSSR